MHLARVRQQAHDVLDHDHRAFHDHSEIERSQRQQIRGNPGNLKTDGGEQKREGNGQRDDQRAADISEKDKQDDRDQDDSFGQVVQHRMRGQMHQVAAVEERDHLDARRKIPPS